MRTETMSSLDPIRCPYLDAPSHPDWRLLGAKLMRLNPFLRHLHRRGQFQVHGGKVRWQLFPLREVRYFVMPDSPYQCRCSNCMQAYPRPSGHLEFRKRSEELGNLVERLRLNREVRLPSVEFRLTRIGWWCKKLDGAA
jgi:hypothetical protein